MLNITYDKKCVYKDGTPWVPYVGEIHYSRIPENEWQTELAKMKAGGLDCISAYVFWNHHEYKEGKFTFTGNRNIGKFLKLCEKVGLHTVLRLGPWCHGEARYGGFPDWLVQKGRELRSNDEVYMACVRRFWQRLYEEVKDCLDNVAAIQIENEYLFGGEGKGDEHIRALTQMAKELGYKAPLFTATGWVSAYIGDCLPTFCGYVCAPWARSSEKLPFNDNYMMKFDQNEFIMDNEFNLVHMAKTPHFDRTQFPYLTCELGGGIQVTRHRRPVIGKKDIGAMAMVKLATGINMFGYFMYHGGTNPVINGTFMQESVETGYPNDYPRLSYDFQAPIGEFGQLNASYGELKLYGMFLNDFGADIAKMNTHLPDKKMHAPWDAESLRVAVRRNQTSGFIFVNNYVRRERMKNHKDVSLSVELENETIVFPARDVDNGDYFFYPFNMPLSNSTLKWIEATPLCKLDGERTQYVFYSQKKNPAREIEGNLLEDEIVCISQTDALNAYKMYLEGKEYLAIYDGALYLDGESYALVGKDDFRLKTYPALPKTPKGFKKAGKSGIFTVYKKSVKKSQYSVSFEENMYGEGGTYKITLPSTHKANNHFLKLHFAGDYVALYKDGVLAADDYYKDGVWRVSLKRLGYPKTLYLKMTPLCKGDKVYLEKLPKYENGKACKLYNAEIEEEFKTTLKFD